MSISGPEGVTGAALLHAAVLGVLALVLAHTLLNDRTAPRLAPEARPRRRPLVSVLLPVRNEGRRVGRCLAAWLRQDYPAYEIVVFDDDSTDDTVASARAAAAGDGRVRLLDGGDLPDGWRGKPWACHRLASEARGDVLVFADADVVAAPGTLRAAVAALETHRLDALSAVPRHAAPSRVVQALVALQNWAFLSFVPAWVPARRRPAALAALNGQFLAMRRRVYQASGGFATVRAALGEDVALARRLARSGFRVALLDGAGVLRSEPYATAAEAWRANARNLLPVFFGSVPVVAAVVLAVAGLYLLPPALLAAGLATGWAGDARWGLLPAAEVALALLARRLADRRAGYPWWVTLSHPLAMAALAGMALASVVGFRWRREVEWRGRRYRVTDAA